jgi:hypothetical protein
MEKHLKGRPRGRPWVKGQSANPAGRPPGSRHKTTLAMLAGIKEAEAELAKPLMLDQTRPYQALSWAAFIQEGRVFRRDNLQELNPREAPPIRPERLDIREHRETLVWRGQECIIQNGWLFDAKTYLPFEP